jgi:uncharacterized protein YegL
MMNVETKIIKEEKDKELLTWIVFLLDRSGSMLKIKTDMIGGFNQFIANQKKVKGKCIASAYQFDDEFETIYEGIDINNIKDLTEETFVPRGWTALYDALVRTINLTNEKIAKLDDEKRPDKILFITITDGEENRSKENTSDDVKKMIQHQTEKWHWDFIYIGANQNAWQVGSNIGYKAGQTLSYVASKNGVNDMWDATDRATTKYRSSINKEFSFNDNKKNT